MSKARKKRDNQVYIKDIAEWKATVAKPILLVAEMFAPHFGPSEIMFPFIDELMVTLDNQGLADKVHWAIVNVVKLEDEKAVSNAEDALKKQETKVGEKTKEESEAALADDVPGPAAVMEQPDDEPDSITDGSEQLDMTIPNLEKYAGFNHPTPHYVFFRNGIVIDELRGANPPKLEQLVRKWVSAEPPTAATDFGVAVAATGTTRVEVPAIKHPDLEAIPVGERPRRGSMSLYAPDDDEPSREPSPERGPVAVAPSDLSGMAPSQSTEAAAPGDTSSAAPSLSTEAAPGDTGSAATSQSAEPVGVALTESSAPLGQVVGGAELSNESAADLAATAPPSTGEELPVTPPAETKSDATLSEAAPGASSDAAEVLKQEPPTIPI